MDIQLIDQQPGFIVVNKPIDIGFHDDSTNLGFFNLVKNKLALPELYPVHRLDKMTSGLLILATDKEAAIKFQTLFANKSIEKYYLAISDAKPKKKQGLIKGDMEKSRRGMWKLTRNMKNPAITQFFSYTLPDKHRLFIVKPHTGKTHQIRVALASIGSPILGDPYYSKSTSDRGYLHAYQLEFTLNDQQFHYQNVPTNGHHFVTKDCLLHLQNLKTPDQLAWPNVK